MFSSLVKYYEGQFFELSRIVCHFFLIKLINKASKVCPSEMDLMIFCIRYSCKKEQAVFPSEMDLIFLHPFLLQKLCTSFLFLRFVRFALCTQAEKTRNLANGLDVFRCVLVWACLVVAPITDKKTI